MKVIYIGDEEIEGLVPILNVEVHTEISTHSTTADFIMDFEFGFGIPLFVEEDSYDACVIVAGKTDKDHGVPLEQVITNLQQLAGLVSSFVTKVWVATPLHTTNEDYKILKSSLGPLLLPGCYYKYNHKPHRQHLLQIQTVWCHP